MITNKNVWIVLFSIAMALLEAAVVVYLRALYYPGEFTVAMKVIEKNILITELAREAATIVMLAGIAIIAGKNFTERFAWFLISFAVWDIFYYAWLKVFINWPDSLFTWDILFLIPVTWLGPVLAPVICSLTMIVLGYLLLGIVDKNTKFQLRRTDWAMLCIGSLFILYTFIQDYAGIIINNGWLNQMDRLLENPEFIRISSSFIPTTYDWPVFIIGEVILAISILTLAIRENYKPSFYAPNL